MLDQLVRLFRESGAKACFDPTAVLGDFVLEFDDGFFFGVEYLFGFFVRGGVVFEVLGELFIV